ncbi:hypothetical protein A2435_02570 [Candidatus Woesebacteria bacterium RIFOXYC1_FULL_46_16]|uniref:Uncharacterized protein n=1 Tax=Candidatus Woesebacteria bacterium RIFOXYC1_FULL_46_16 TaxID=1802546 RepID=A0A1F8DF62_9BACT|nr:MAG: hypothetical protein A2435_02570 [Candidatus Woesebacteria bacterium RIFOXYC1_FULL_46_16]
MGKEDAITFGVGPNTTGSPETQGGVEPLESLDRLVHLFRKREISFGEYFDKLRLHANRIDFSSYADRFLDQVGVRGESKIKPTFDETQMAHDIERVVTADYREGRIAAEQYAFLTDRLFPFTRLDFRGPADELSAARARTKW